MKPIRKALLWSLYGVLSISVLGMLAGYYVFSGWGLCANTVYQVIESPDKTYKAVLFERNCGATTGFSTQVSVVPIDFSLPEEEGNVFIVDGHPDNSGLKLNWRSGTQLTINNADPQAFKAEERMDSVTIEYEFPRH